MGFFAHDAVLVHILGYTTSTQPNSDYPKVRFPDLDAFRATLPAEFARLVIGPVPTVVNGDFTAVFLPDGSKEGRPESDLGDEYRLRFVALFGRYEDGSTPFDVAVVRFGGDEPSEAWIQVPEAAGVVR